MAQPTPYTRQFSFSGFQTSNPSSPLSAAQLEAELNAVKATLDQILTNLAVIQRDDGELANASVGAEQLQTALVAGINPPVRWTVAPTAYSANDTVIYIEDPRSEIWLVHTAHTSTTDFDADSAAFMTQLGDFSGVLNTADAVTYDDASRSFTASTVQDAIDAVDTSAVRISGNQTVAGVKTLTSGPVVSADEAILDLHDADGTGTFSRARVAITSAEDLEVQTRQGDGTAVTTDLKMVRSAAGVTAHEWNLLGVKKADLTSAGLNVVPALLQDGVGVVLVSGAQSIAGNKTLTGLTTFESNVLFQGTGPIVDWVQTGAATDEKRYRIRRTNGDMQFTTLADNGAETAVDYRVVGTATGASEHRFSVQGTERASITATGLEVTGEITRTVQNDTFHVRDEKAANTGGGTSVATTWTARTINTTKTNEITGASLASNQITLPAGTYTIEWAVAARNINMRTRIRNVTDSSTIATGVGQAIANDLTNGMVRSFAKFTLAAEKDLEIQYFASSAIANGLGLAINLDSTPEVYLDAVITKIL